jgi:hypothetical protein
VASGSRYDVAGFARLTGEASVRAPFWLGTRVGVRLFGGAYLSGSDPVKQRRIMVAGADPYETFTNPLLRSVGALFVRPDFHYQEPGDADARAFRPDLGGRWAAALNAELERPLFRRTRGLGRAVAPEAFCGVALVEWLATGPSGCTARNDAGFGIVARQETGDLHWALRAEFPIEMNAWRLAPDYGPTDGRIAFRWLVSLAPSF